MIETIISASYAICVVVIMILMVIFLYKNIKNSDEMTEQYKLTIEYEK